MPLPVNARDEAGEIKFWMTRIKSRLESEDYVEWDKVKKDAKDFYKGKLISDEFRKEWGGDTVELNMWRRTLIYFVDALFAQNPNFVVRPRPGRTDDRTLAAAASLEDFLRYVWSEMDMDEEARRVLKDAYFGNIAVAKWDWDKTRELPRMRWMAGRLVVDPEAHGALNRANWAVEEVSMTVLRILQDESFSLEKRKAYSDRIGITVADIGSKMFDKQKKVYYVHTREGCNPIASLEVIDGGDSYGSKNKLIIFVEDWDQYLFQTDDPFPWLDSDEFPFALLRLDETPGEFIGTPIWQMLQSMINALNWLMSYHLTDMKKKATDLIGVNKNIIKNPLGLVTKSHMEIVECDGDPKMAVAPLNIGKGDQTSLQGAAQVMEWLDRLAGTSEIVRGEATGRKTAEEARYLQENSSLVLKGPGMALDGFLESCVRLLGLSSLHYIPAYSRSVGPDGQIMTKAKQETIDPASGQPVQNVVDQPVAPEEAESLGAVKWADDQGNDYGMRMPDTQASMGPMGLTMTHPSPGKTLRRGVDYFVGPDAALNWPEMPLEDIKRDLMLTFEAGSTRAGWRADQQQAAQALLETFGPIYQQVGFPDQLYELLLTIAKSSPLPDTNRLVPPRAQFVAAFNGMMQAQTAAAQSAAAPPPAPPPDPTKQQEVALKQQEFGHRSQIDERKMTLEERKANAEAAPVEEKSKALDSIHEGMSRHLETMEASAKSGSDAVAVMVSGLSDVTTSLTKAAGEIANAAGVMADKACEGPKKITVNRDSAGKIISAVVK